MKKDVIQLFKFSLQILIFAVLAINVNAQSLANLQKQSLRIADDVKIDGKSTEWSGAFQAYNRGTEVFYTMANNDTALYLIVKAVDPLVIRKIITGSITFTIKPSEKRIGQDIALTYPVFDKKNWPVLNLKSKPKLAKDSTIYNIRLDSFMYATNKQLVDKSKMIKILGMKDIDTLISVYNQTGIKAAALFDHNISYVYELSVPLKYLGLSIDNIQSLSYNIKINGSNSVEGVTIVDEGHGGYHLSWTNTTNVPTEAEIKFMRYATDLTGEYTLAKKP